MYIYNEYTEFYTFYPPEKIMSEPAFKMSTLGFFLFFKGEEAVKAPNNLVLLCRIYKAGAHNTTHITKINKVEEISKKCLHIYTFWFIIIA